MGVDNLVNQIISIDPGVHGGIGAAVFDPNSITGLVTWFKADAGTSTVVDGVAVTQWNDQASVPHNATQATGANQPLFKTAIQNGLPGILFDGSNDSLDATGVVRAQPDTIFVVSKSNVTTQFKSVIDGITTRQAILASAAAAKFEFFAGVEVASAVAFDTAAHSESAIFNGASSQLWLDGNSIATGNPGANTLNGLRIGSSDQTATTTWSGHIFEILIYDTSLSVANRQNVESYLRSKWGTP